MNKSLDTMILEDANSIIKCVDLGYLSNKSILITGASGLLGNYFVASLKQFSEKTGNLFSLTSITNGDPVEPLISLMHIKEARILKGDLTDQNFLNQLGAYDIIIHAATYGQPGRFMENPIKTLELNTSSTLSLMKHLNDSGKFLFISSSELYSGLINPPFTEYQIGTTNTTHPRSCYIEGKRSGEAICNAYRSLGVDAKSARLALAYGPGTKKGDKRVLNSFIERALNKGVIQLQDNGHAKRTYCYVADAVEILWKILLEGTEPIYNVGGQSKTTILDLAKLIAEYTEVSITTPCESSSDLGAPEDVWLDMSLVEHHFNKQDYVPLNQGLLRTIKWQQILYS